MWLVTPLDARLSEMVHEKVRNLRSPRNRLQEHFHSLPTSALRPHILQRWSAHSIIFRKLAICCAIDATSARAARISRTECGPCCRLRPFAAALAFPVAVFGPVEYSQGRFFIAACRSRSRPPSVNGPRFFRFLRPAATRLGFGVESVSWGMSDPLISLFGVSIK